MRLRVGAALLESKLPHVSFMKAFWVVVAALGVVSSAARAQNAFAAIEDGTSKIVKQIRMNRPVVDAGGGKLTGTASNQFALMKAKLYRPGLVTWKELKVGTYHSEDMGGGRFNYEIRITGRATSDTNFKNCFLVLEMASWKDTGWVFTEIPDMPAGRSIDFNFAFPLAVQIEGGSYHVHLFSDGIEILHTRMPPPYVTAQKKKTEELLAGRQKDFPAIPARPVPAKYPDELKDSGVTGSASVRCTVTTRGEVSRPELVHATNEAFGRAAMEAVVQWKFDPALKDRRIVESNFVVPFSFKPPSK
jgi:TonB family protein